MSTLLLGTIVNTRGLKGELKLLADPNYSDLQFSKGAQLSLGQEIYCLENYRWQKNTLIFTLQGFSHINEVELLVGVKVSVKSDQLRPKPAGDFYAFELIGYKVYDQNDDLIGEVSRVQDSGFQRVLRIQREGKDALIPWVDFFVKTIDATTKSIRVEVIEGLL